MGGALGLAVLATLSASRTDTLTERGESAAAALTGGYHLAFWIAAALVVAAIVVALTRGAARGEGGGAARGEAERRRSRPRGAGWPEAAG